MSYRVKEIFRTVQGEGAFAGKAAVFVRFVGCNMWSGYEQDRERDAERNAAACPLWCDTDFTKEDRLGDFSARDLADVTLEAGAKDTRFVVMTGGEPLLQADAALMRAFRQRGVFVSIETNGTQTLERFAGHPPDWVVCSPKLPESRLRLKRLDELKLVVPDYQPARYKRFARRVRLHRQGSMMGRYLWLQPEDGPRLEEAKDEAVALALQHPEWRVSVQTHKVLGVA